MDNSLLLKATCQTSKFQLLTIQRKACAVCVALVFCLHSQLFAQVPTEPVQEPVKEPVQESAQQPVQEPSLESVPESAQESVQETTQEQAPLDLTVASDGNVSAKGDILRLEETIRGNKEQPKVLSIVPWQLPLYQRIDRNEQRWAPIKTKLKPLERNSFLKEIKLLKGVQNNQASTSVDTSSN